MFKNSLELGEYQFYLDKLLRTKEHILSEKEEAILAATGPMAGTAMDVFQQMTGSDLKLGTVIGDDGEVIELTRGRYYALMEEASREVRKAASDTVQAHYMKYINSLSTNLGGQLKNDYFYTNVRGYENSLEASLDNNNIPTEVYHSLIKAVNDNIETLHKYARLRKKVLGVDTLFSYDMSVPLGPKSTRKYTYEEAIEFINNGLKPMGQKYLDEVNNGLASRWVDVYETEGKETGAYQWGTYTSHPYIKLNFTGRLDDVFTLAHEMGHAMNQFYANQNEPYIYHNTAIFTAEVASTCNEAILMKFFLANTTDKNEKMALLDYYIDQIIGTFFTQVMFAEFELAIHQQVDNGGATSVDFFRKTYRDIYQKYYGPEFVISKDKDIHGMKIYHFYRNYYVYQYATSYAAAQMISQRIVDGEEGALESYFKFLSTGSSKYPIDVLKEAGVDLTQPEAVNRTIKLFGELVDEMERLLNES
jgi:oligoendopeptidase F